MNAVRRSFVKIVFPQISNSSLKCALHRSISSPAFKSSLSLQNIYPTSTLKLVTPEKVETKTEGFSGYIPVQDLDITYAKSSGPGGQNVNKVNTKVDVRFKVADAKWIEESVKENLLAQQKNTVNNEGYLIIKSDLTRSQQLNLADALEKLRNIIRRAYGPVKVEPSIQTVEKHRRRHERSVRERLMIKRQRSSVKADRRAPDVDF